MPTILRSGASRLFFYAGDGAEAMHIHVRRDRFEVKYWLDPVALARNRGFTERELNRIERLVVEHAQIPKDAWHDYFES